MCDTGFCDDLPRFLDRTRWPAAVVPTDANYTREDARDDHAITQWETARDLGEA